MLRKVRMTTATPVQTPATITATEERLEPPFAVILYNDDVNSMQHVVDSIMHCVPELTPEEADEIMLEAHQAGQARVIVAPHERAARYRNCLESRGLTATIEPV